MKIPLRNYFFFILNLLCICTYTGRQYLISKNIPVVTWKHLALSLLCLWLDDSFHQSFLIAISTSRFLRMLAILFTYFSSMMPRVPLTPDDVYGLFLPRLPEPAGSRFGTDQETTAWAQQAFVQDDG